MLTTEIGYAQIISSTPLFRNGQVVYVSKLNHEGYHVNYIEHQPARFTVLRFDPDTLYRIDADGNEDRSIWLDMSEIDNDEWQVEAQRWMHND